MCTVTWIETDAGYHLFSNRDELRTRGRAAAPRLHGGTGGRYLAPTDADAGGTWIAVNDRGVGLTLLNDYGAEARCGPSRKGLESRGLLMTRLAAVGPASAVLATLTALDLERYRPFRLVVLAPGAPAEVRHWDGRRLAAETPAAPPLLTSSSRDPVGADAARRALLDGLEHRGEVAGLVEFHRSHAPERGPLSPCMHREDARTVSFTHVEVTPERAVMRYRDGPPCRASTPADEALVLPLRSLPATAGA